MSISRAASASADRIEACVIGAGVVGLAVARALAMAGKEVLILESENKFGSGTSSRNSEVIHAGIYYPTGSLKAQLCVKGKHMLYEYCKQRDIPYDQKGKIIVATDDTQLNIDIPRIMKHAAGNGVKDLVLLSSHDVETSFEPDVSCTGALLSPSTGIIDSHAYMLSLLADAEDYGATLAPNSAVDDISIANDDRIIVESEGMQIECDIVVNCAGLYAHKIAEMVDLENTPRQYFAKGNYYKLEGQKTPFNHLIYPVPTKGGLGVHATMCLMGSTRFGPDVEWIENDVSNPSDIDLKVNTKRLESFYSEVRKYWPHLKDGALQPDYAGIRPKLGHPNVPDEDGPSINADFHIQTIPSRKGFVNLMGIESPGLTASMAIAEKVVKILTVNGKI
jgi:L-2-hydroxyglutarate oxidase LhgO